MIDKKEAYIKSTLGETNYEELLEFWKGSLGEMKDMELIKFEFAINDDGDYVIRILQSFLKIKKKSVSAVSGAISQLFNSIKETNGCQRDKETCSIFYYESHKVCESSEGHKFLIYDGKEDILTGLQGFTLNGEYLFFWNLGKIFRMNIHS